jgi:hypothetical protein
VFEAIASQNSAIKIRSNLLSVIIILWQKYDVPRIGRPTTSLCINR